MKDRQTDRQTDYFFNVIDFSLSLSCWILSNSFSFSCWILSNSFALLLDFE